MVSGVLAWQVQYDARLDAATRDLADFAPAGVKLVSPQAF